MSGKNEKVIHVDNLIIHAKNIDIIQDRKEEVHVSKKDPWEVFWGRKPRGEVHDKKRDADKDH